MRTKVTENVLWWKNMLSLKRSHSLVELTKDIHVLLETKEKGVDVFAARIHFIIHINPYSLLVNLCVIESFWARIQGILEPAAVNWTSKSNGGYDARQGEGVPCFHNQTHSGMLLFLKTQRKVDELDIISFLPWLLWFFFFFASSLPLIGFSESCLVLQYRLMGPLMLIFTMSALT